MAGCIHSSAVIIFCFEKWRKNLLLVLLTDADPRINYTNLNLHHSRVCGPELTFYFDRTILRRKFDRVRYQVQ